MDVWRYSDWDGFGAEVRESQPHIWRWRDWIVESLNRDLPYDRMVRAMLAADETDPCDSDTLRATGGFLARNWYKFNRNVWLENTVEHTAKAFLGLTLNCAKCHDHKYDPIAQTDYYAFRAFFEPYTVRTDPVPGQPDTTKAGLVRVYDDQATTPTFVFDRGDEKRPIKERPLKPSVPLVLAARASLGPIKPQLLPPQAFYPGMSGFVREEAIARAKGAIAAQKAALLAGEHALAGAHDRAAAEKAQHAVALAKKALNAARAEHAAIEARIAADVARYAVPPHADATALAHIAGRLDRRRALLAAEEALLKAEFADQEARNRPGKTGNAQMIPPDTAMPLAKAREAVAAARKAANDDAAGYPPLTPIYSWPAARAGGVRSPAGSHTWTTR